MQLGETPVLPRRGRGAFNRPAGVTANTFYCLTRLALTACGDGSGVRRSRQLGGRPDGPLLRRSRCRGLPVRAEETIPTASPGK